MAETKLKSPIILLDFQDSGNIAQTATPNSITDITGATVTFTPPAACLVKISLQLVIQNNTDTDYFIISIYKDGSLLADFTYRPSVAGIGSSIPYIYFEDNVTAAAHTYKVRWQNSHTGDQLQCVKGHLYTEVFGT